MIDVPRLWRYPVIFETPCLLQVKDSFHQWKRMILLRGKETA